MKKSKIQMVLSMFFVVVLAFSVNANILLKMDNDVKDMPGGTYVLIAKDVARYATVKSYMNNSFDEASKITEGYYRGVQELLVSDGNFIEFNNTNIMKIGPSMGGVTSIDTDKVTVFNPDNDIDLNYYTIVGSPANAPLETTCNIKTAPLKIQIFKPTVMGKDAIEVADINNKLDLAVDLIYKQSVVNVKSSPRPEDVGSSIFIFNVRETACTKKRFMIEFKGEMVVGYGNRTKPLKYTFIYDRRSKQFDVKEGRGTVG